MKSKNLRILTCILSVLLIVCAIISLNIGRYTISTSDVIAIITSKSVDETARNVFFTLRLPRTIVAAMAGIGLGVAGFVYQSLFKNPLASPDIIGVAKGANAGAAIGILTVGSTASIFISAYAFVGGIIAAFAAIGLASLSKHRTLASVVLSGIVISSVSEAIIMTLKLFADPESELAPLEFWSMGGLSSITFTKMMTVLPGFTIGIILLFALRYRIFLLTVSEDEARSLGVKVTTTRAIVLFAATLLVSSIVSVTGLITFIGLIAPHCARLITRRNNTQTAVLSGLIGGIIIIFADCVARGVTTSEIPISILTSIIGAPFLVALMLKKDNSSFY